MFQSSDGAQWKTAERGTFRNERLIQSRRFLPCDSVTGYSEKTPKKVTIHTTCGDSEIWFEPYRLEDKAKHYEKIAVSHSRHGFVADTHAGKPFSNDNDGLWTAMYAAAKLFEYKATGSKAALGRAETAVRAVLSLEKVTGTPGYPARSFIDPTEEKPKDGFWYWTADRKYEFKSDTSSDEIVGHFLVFALAWDLLPPGELRDDARATCRRLMDYMLAHDFYLIDPKSGKPTRWGKWNLEYFNGEGKEDAPLNALEWISFLRVTAHVTGDAKYEREIGKAVKLGYLKLTGRQKEQREELNYSDEELAMLSFYPLLVYEKNPAYRRAILKALDDWFENMRPQQNPLWNSIYEVFRGEDMELRKASVATLERMPMDLRNWRVENSWRKAMLKPGTLLPPDERPVRKWNSNPFVLDGGRDGSSEDDGTTFLLPYWMGRYHKLWGER